MAIAIRPSTASNGPDGVPSIDHFCGSCHTIQRITSWNSQAAQNPDDRLQALKIARVHRVADEAGDRHRSDVNCEIPGQ